MKRPLTANDKLSWFTTIWAGLDKAREDGGLDDAAWDEVCTAMAWLEEEMGFDTMEVANACDECERV